MQYKKFIHALLETVRINYYFIFNKNTIYILHNVKFDNELNNEMIFIVDVLL